MRGFLSERATNIVWALSTIFIYALCLVGTKLVIENNIFNISDKIIAVVFAIIFFTIEFIASYFISQMEAFDPSETWHL